MRITQTLEAKMDSFVRFRNSRTFKAPRWGSIIGAALALNCLTVKLNVSNAQLKVSRENPRYFVSFQDTTRAVFLAGSHTWLNNRDGGRAIDIAHVPIFNWQGYLNFLTAQHHNLVKYWCWENDWNNLLSTVTDFRYAPYSPYERTGPGTAEDGAPKFNLDSLDQRYFDRVSGRMDTLAGRGIYAVVMLFNGWSVAADKGFGGQNVFKGHPFNSANNTQGVGFTDPNGDNTQRLPGQGGSNTILAYQVTYVKKMIDVLNPKNNVLWEISNESNSNSQDWQYAIIDTIKNYELRKPKQHPINMSVEYPGGNNGELFAANAHNQGASPSTDYSSQVDNDTSRVLISDTDHICGECKDGDWVYRSFCNGVGSILYMDPWDGRNYPHIASNYDSSASSWVNARKAMGQVAVLANTLNIIDMRPTPSLSSTGSCLSSNRKWVVYQPGNGSFTVNLSSTTDSLSVGWINITNGTTQAGPKVSGGSSSRSFSPPSSNHHVLFLYSDQLNLAPQPPALLQPQDGATVNADSIRFTWSRRNPSILNYQWELSGDTAFSNPVVDSTLTDTTKLLTQQTVPGHYWWRVRARSWLGWGPKSQARSIIVVTTGLRNQNGTPSEVKIFQNYPNPFNPTTTISYTISQQGPVVIEVINVLGQRVRTLVSEVEQPGHHEVLWDGKDGQGNESCSGIYICRLSTNRVTHQTKMLLVR